MYLGTMVQGVHRKLSYKSRKLTEVPEEEWIRVPDTHEPIIDRKTFAAVREQRRQGHRRSPAGGPPHLLAGLVRCGLRQLHEQDL